MKSLITYTGIALLATTILGCGMKLPNGTRVMNCQQYQSQENISGRYITCTKDSYLEDSYFEGIVQEIGYVQEFVPKDESVNSLISISIIKPEKTGSIYNKLTLVVYSDRTETTRICTVTPDDDPMSLDILLSTIKKGNKVKIPTLKKVSYVTHNINGSSRSEPLFRVLSTTDECDPKEIIKLDSID